MSDGETRAPFQVLSGGGEARPRRDLAPLRVVAPAISTPTQLCFPFSHLRSNSVISVGYDILTLGRLEGILAEHSPRVIADVRVSPSFRRGDLSRHAVRALLEHYRVKYGHFAGLANVFVGDSWDHTLSLERFAASIEAAPHLDELRRLLDEGPILLLGRLPSHEQSERSVLVDALQRRADGFDLIIINE